MTLVLTEEQLALLRRSALEESPVEACALLFGKASADKTDVLKVVLADNKLRSPVKFEVDPMFVYTEIKKAEEEGLEFVGIFHSHHAPVEPSVIDLKFMRLWGSSIWLIFSTLDGRIAAFQKIDGEVKRVEIKVKKGLEVPYHAQIVENLSRMLKPQLEIKNADAAVALLLKPANQDFDILFVKRTESPSDPWSGQTALPGGKRDTKDENLRQTLFREVLEETNINLTRDCLFLGALETLRSEVKPKLLVAPFVILLEHEPMIVLNEELEGYLWMSLKKLRGYRGTAKLPFGEASAYLVEGSVIWGLTYRILEGFIEILENAEDMLET